jgi:hypothetical protein
VTKVVMIGRRINSSGMLILIHRWNRSVLAQGLSRQQSVDLSVLLSIT